MGGAVGTRGGLTSALLLVLLAVGAAPGAALAAAPSRAVVLPGDAHAALVADVDGDGTNEVVRILGDTEIGHVVETWGYDDEAWRLRGSVGIPELTRSASARPIASANDASALLVWRADGRARVLVWARWGASADDPDAFPCCVSVHELIWQDGATHLERRPLDGGMADSVQVLDVDGDGTDELMRTQWEINGGTGVVDVLRWEGEAFRSILREEGEALIGGAWAGNTDGHLGDDLTLGPSPQGDVLRVAWVDGGLVTEEAHLELGERSEGWVSGFADGAFVLTLPDELRIVRWARGEQPVTTARLSGLVYPYAGIIGAGPESLLAVQTQIFGSGGSIPPLAIYDLQLNPRGEVTPAPLAQRLTDVINRQTSSGRPIGRYLYPYVGSLPGASPGTSAGWMHGGMLVSAALGGDYETRGIAPLAGSLPIGLAGPEDGWVVSSAGYLGGGNVAYLGGTFVPPGLGMISLVPLDELLSDEGMRPTIELRNAVVVGEPGDEVTQLLAAADGFEAVVAAPAGTWVTAWDGRGAEEATVVEGSVAVEILPPRGRRNEDKDQEFRASLVVVSPDGHATVVEWAGTFIREPPELVVVGRTDALAFSATLEGTVGPLATVTVDGRPVSVAADGAFGTTVDAGPWPRSVIVSARDPLGNEVVERVEVIGLYDYRGLPWAAIVGIATLSAGAVLFLKIPQRRPRDLPELGDGRLEELDPIDGATLQGR